MWHTAEVQEVNLSAREINNSHVRLITPRTDQPGRIANDMFVRNVVIIEIFFSVQKREVVYSGQFLSWV